MSPPSQKTDADNRPKVSVDRLEIAATDGYTLAASRYLPNNFEGADVVVICPATGVKRGFYHRYARFLAEAGFQVLTFDYRGIGDSRPLTLNKFAARMRDWGEKDIAGVFEWIKEKNPESKIFIVGHSVAGQVLGLAHNNYMVSAVLTVASQSGYWKLWPWHLRYLIFLFWCVVIPGFTTLFGYFPSRLIGMGEDLPAGVAFEWASWGRDPDYLMGKDSLSSKRNFARCTATWLSYSVANDFFAPSKSVDRLLTFYPNIKASRKHLTADIAGGKRLGHFDFFKEKVKKTLWREGLDWLKEQTREQNFPPSEGLSSRAQA